MTRTGVVSGASCPREGGFGLGRCRSARLSKLSLFFFSDEPFADGTDAI